MSIILHKIDTKSDQAALRYTQLEIHVQNKSIAFNFNGDIKHFVGKVSALHCIYILLSRRFKCWQLSDIHV